MFVYLHWMLSALAQTCCIFHMHSSPAHCKRRETSGHEGRGERERREGEERGERKKKGRKRERRKGKEGKRRNCSMREVCVIKFCHHLQEEMSLAILWRYPTSMFFSCSSTSCMSGWLCVRVMV